MSMTSQFPEFFSYNFWRVFVIWNLCLCLSILRSVVEDALVCLAGPFSNIKPTIPALQRSVGELLTGEPALKWWVGLVQPWIDNYFRRQPT